VRAYRAREATRTGKHGRRLSPFTVLDSHKALLTFLRWAKDEGYEFDGRILELKRPKVPKPKADVYHMSQLRAILAACNRRVPQEELIVRILVGSGVRASELCGLALVGPDGLCDVMTDSITRGRVELRVRWDGGANAPLFGLGRPPCGMRVLPLQPRRPSARVYALSSVIVTTDGGVHWTEGRLAPT
jgi:hypothetical protein